MTENQARRTRGAFIQLRRGIKPSLKRYSFLYVVIRLARCGLQRCSHQRAPTPNLNSTGGFGVESSIRAERCAPPAAEYNETY